jgi:hypothetical protein
MPAITRSQATKLATNNALITAISQLTKKQLKLQFSDACFDGDLSLIKLYCQNCELLPTNFNEGFVSACMNGQLELAYCLYQYRPDIIHDIGVYALGRAIKRGHIKLVLWLHPLLVEQGEQYRLRQSYAAAFYDTCLNGHFNTAQWLYRTDHSVANSYGKISKIYNQLPKDAPLAIWLNKLRRHFL